MRSLSLAAVLAASSFAALPLLAQNSGVSNPPEAVDPTPALTVQEAPAAARVSPPATLQRHPYPAADDDSGIVESIPQRPDQLNVGTLLRARLITPIATASTQTDTPFTASIDEPVMHLGSVIIPAGSSLRGRVTEIHGGRRFRGAAMIHLQADDILLPDGSRVPLRASVIDTDQLNQTRVDAEGNVVRRDHSKQTLAEISLAAGGGAAAGGVVAGVPGALVGAGIGAGVGTAWWLKQDRQTALPAGALLVMSLTSPLHISSPVREPEFSTAPVVDQPIAPAARRSVAAPSAQSFVPTE